MNIPRLGRNRSIKFNVTPLIDVVFLLIIFFLVSSHLAQQETQLELALPTASSVRDDESHTERVTINVRADGQLLLGSEAVSTAEVGRRLGVERQETSANLEVRIRADRNLAYRHIEPVLLACAKAQIWNVSFAVIEKPIL